MQPHPDRGQPVESGMTVEEDAGAVFRAAIAAGVLSAEPADRNWAGHYFYMFHDRDGAAWFKHRDSRTHVTVAAAQAGNGP
ncbi:MAG: hypothetical protein OXM58_19195 [Rhodospirillaceae bacterium]|nr:hypothetical protein [Rhodospirillaceae bacterium]MDE0379672.1 hypothetical protein [Rhodospirillales bacterium]